MVDSYVAHYKDPARGGDLHRDALEWSTTRGARSGRVAWQFVQDLAGRLGVALKRSRRGSMKTPCGWDCMM